MSKPSHREDFPIARFVKPTLRPLIEAYYRAAREADDTADDPHLDRAQKLQRLDEFEKAFYAGSDNAAGALGRLFAAERLDYRLYTDLLEAFRRDAAEQPIDVWERLLDYCRFSAVPVGRFVLAVHDEPLETYLPAETLCTVLQIVNHLRDLKTDACQLRRCYLPQDMMRKYDVTLSDLCLLQSPPRLRNLISEIVSRLRAMCADSAILLSLVKNRRLKTELGVIYSLTYSMLKKINKGDVLHCKPRLTRIDWLRATAYGLWKGLFTRTKSCRIRK